MGLKDFFAGSRNDPTEKYRIRSMSQQIDYDRGRRAGGHTGGGFVPVGGSFDDAAPFFKASLLCALIGLIVGFGYGLWQPFTDSASPGFGEDAMTVLKWMGIGAGAGALTPTAAIAGVGLALLAAIFWGLGLLLNFLTSL